MEHLLDSQQGSETAEPRQPGRGLGFKVLSIVTGATDRQQALRRQISDQAGREELFGLGSFLPPVHAKQLQGHATVSHRGRRKQSLQRVHEEGKRVFDELSEKLYTLEAHA